MTKWPSTRIRYRSVVTVPTFQAAQVIMVEEYLWIPRLGSKQGDAVFSCYAALIWNKLLENDKTTETFSSFKSRLKTYLLRAAFD